MSKTGFAKGAGPAISGDAQNLAAGLRRLDKVLTGTGKAYLSKGDCNLDPSVILDNARVQVVGANSANRTLHIPYVNREVIFSSHPNNLFEFDIATDKMTISLKPGQSIKVFMDGFGGMDVLGGSSGGGGQGHEGKRGPEGPPGRQGERGGQGNIGPRGPQGNPGPADPRFQIQDGRLLFVSDQGTFVISATKLPG